MTNLAGADEPAVQLSPRARLEILGAVIVIFLREQPMRETFEMTEAASDASAA